MAPEMVHTRLAVGAIYFNFYGIIRQISDETTASLMPIDGSAL